MKAVVPRYENRLIQIFQILDRESFHLSAVIQRLFGQTDLVDAAWVEKRLSDPNGIDVLESFGGKFSRFQDTLSDKLLSAFLQAAGEIPGTVVENINRAERLGLVRDAQEWLGARGLRNKLVHEYVNDPAELADSLNAAREISQVLLTAHQKFFEYTTNKLGIRLTE